MCHDHKTPYSYNWRIWRIHYSLTFLSNFHRIWTIFLENKCLSVIIHFKLRFTRSVVRCCMWYICSYRTKISILSQRECSFSIPNSLFNWILNVRNLIICEGGFNFMLFPHRYCNTYYLNISFDTEFKVEKKSCTFFIPSFFWIHVISVSVHNTNLIGKDVPISTNKNPDNDNSSSDTWNCFGWSLWSNCKCFLFNSNLFCRNLYLSDDVWVMILIQFDLISQIFPSYKWVSNMVNVVLCSNKYLDILPQGFFCNIIWIYPLDFYFFWWFICLSIVMIYPT